MRRSECSVEPVLFLSKGKDHAGISLFPFHPPSSKREGGEGGDQFAATDIRVKSEAEKSLRINDKSAIYNINGFFVSLLSQGGSGYERK